LLPGEHFPFCPATRLLPGRRPWPIMVTYAMP
jgi:hypothetical protein